MTNRPSRLTFDKFGVSRTSGLGLAFMTIFDPVRGATVEEVRKRKDLGDADAGESGEGKD